MDFDERLHGEFAAKGHEILQELVAERGNDQQKTISVVGAGFPNLPGIKNKIFAENGKCGFFSRVAQIFQGAVEEFAFGEDGEGCGAGSFERFGQSGRIERVADDSAGRGRFEFGQNIDAIAEKSGGEIADGRGGFYAVFKGCFGENVLAMFDVGAARSKDAVEDGSGVGVGSHGWKFVC